MIVTIPQGDDTTGEVLNALRFAARATQIKVQAKIVRYHFIMKHFSLHPINTPLILQMKFFNCSIVLSSPVIIMSILSALFILYCLYCLYCPYCLHCPHCQFLFIHTLHVIYYVSCMHLIISLLFCSFSQLFNF